MQSVTRFAPLDGQLRPAWAEVDLGAIRHNAAVLAAEVRPARLCAVVKAAGYGHGAPEVARAALEGGAEWLAVALVEEGRELRAAGIDAPVLVLSEPAPSAMQEVVEYSLTPTLYTAVGLDALQSAVGATAAAAPFLSISRSTPECTGSGRPRATPFRSPCRSRPAHNSAWGASGPTSPCQTRSTTRTRPNRSGDSSGLWTRWPTPGWRRTCGTRPTPAAPFGIPAAASTWCAAASPFTASPRARTG